MTVAKAINDFARTSRILKVRGGVAGQRSINEASLVTIAALPSRQVLLGRVVGQIQAPLTGLVSVLSGTIRKFVYVLQARVDQGGRVQGFRQQPATLQRAAEDGDMRGQLGSDARCGGGDVFGQGQVGAPVTDAGGNLRCRVADQVKLHSIPR